MKRNTLNYLTDVLAALVVVGLVGTGLIMEYVLPPGTGHRYVLLGWDRHAWGNLHFWIAAGGAGVLILHLALHWTWTWTTTRHLLRPAVQGRGRGALWRSAWGVVALGAVAMMFAGMVLVARGRVQSVPGGPEFGRGMHRYTADNAD